MLCADNHFGYSQPIGAAIAYRNMVSPSGVGYDIGCGNKAVRTDLDAEILGRHDIEQIMDEIVATLSFGVDCNNKETVEDSVIDEIAGAEEPFNPHDGVDGR